MVCFLITGDSGRPERNIYTQKPEKAILGTRAAAESGCKMNQWGKFTPPEKAGWARVAAAGPPDHNGQRRRNARPGRVLVT